MHARTIMNGGTALVDLPLPASPDLIDRPIRRRRASDRIDRIEKPEPGKSSWLSRAHPSAGTLLLVHQSTVERPEVETAARLAGLHVIAARNPGEALQLLREQKSGIDLLFILPQASPSGDLIRDSLEIRPGIQILLMVESGCREGMRIAYEAGATSIILPGSTTEQITIFLKQSLHVAREARRRDLLRRERRERHASEFRGRRVLRKIYSWVKAPSGTRRAAQRAIVLAGAVALLVGIGLAVALDRYHRSVDRDEAILNRLLEGRTPPRDLRGSGDAASLHWQAVQQLGLAREANDITRRYYQDHLQELRWQGNSRSNEARDPGPRPGLEEPAAAAAYLRGAALKR